MTPEDLSQLSERLLDDAVPPAERAALAARIARDADLRQALADELGLALQIRATLAEDGEARADLLMATLSGSRRLALAERIDSAIDRLAPPTATRWLRWSGLAAAALLMALVGGWWSQRVPARSAVPDPQLTMPRSPSAVPRFDPAPGPDATTSTPPIAVEPPTTLATPFATASATPSAPVSPQEPTVGDPAPHAAGGPAPESVPGTVADLRPEDRAAQPPNATQASRTLPKVDPRSLRGIPPLLITGPAQVRRQGRVADSVSDLRLIPGDEVRIAGEGATLKDERGMSWWCAVDTRLALPPARPVEVVRQPLHVAFGTMHVTASNGLRPLITTPHLRIDAEEADLWLTVTTLGTRVETLAGTVRIELVAPGTARPGSTTLRGGSKSVRPLAPGFYARSLPGAGLEIHPVGEGRLSVIAGRFARDGALRIPRILRGVSATVAADLGGTALQAPLGDGAWLDQAAYRHLTALVEMPANLPAIRVLRHPALGAWIATSDARAASAMRRADPLRPIHLAGPAPARLPPWATSSELGPGEEAPTDRATLAMVAVDAQVHAASWEALIRGAQGLVWNVGPQLEATALLQPLLEELDASEGLLTDGRRSRLDLGHGLSAAQWEHPGRRLVAVINRGDEAQALRLPHGGGLAPLAVDESLGLATSGDLLTATLPAHGVLILHGALP